MPPQIGTEGLPSIPAMTTDAERECYYRLAKEAASKGAIVELGAWMGASTAYIAAGIRDSGVKAKAQVYDKFVSRPGHVRKVKEFYSKRNIDKAPIGPSLMAFRENLGRLMQYVEPHQGSCHCDLVKHCACSRSRWRSQFSAPAAPRLRNPSARAMPIPCRPRRWLTAE
jgi:hypothetical protein